MRPWVDLIRRSIYEAHDRMFAVERREGSALEGLSTSGELSTACPHRRARLKSLISRPSSVRNCSGESCRKDVETLLLTAIEQASADGVAILPPAANCTPRKRIPGESLTVRLASHRLGG